MMNPVRNDLAFKGNATSRNYVDKNIAWVDRTNAWLSIENMVYDRAQLMQIEFEIKDRLQ